MTWRFRHLAKWCASLLPMRRWTHDRAVASVVALGGGDQLTTLGADDYNLFAPAELAQQIARITRQKLAYWDFVEIVRPTIRRRMSLTKIIRLYTVDDLVTLLVVVELRRRNFTLQHVRKVARFLRTAYGYERPLAEVTVATDGKEIFIGHPDGTWEGDKAPSQLIIREVVSLDEVRNIVLDAMRRRRREDEGRTDQKRGRVANKVTFKGTRIPVTTVVRWLEHGASTGQILEAYPDLGEGDVELARRELSSASA